MAQTSIPIIDLFAGPGGLSEGFSALSDRRGEPIFQVCLSIEKDDWAYKTLLLRTFFRYCDTSKPRQDYYRYLRGDDELPEQAELLSRHPTVAKIVREQVWQATLGGTSDSEIRERVATVLRRYAPHGQWVLIGGPPCQAYSLVGRARMMRTNGSRFSEDERHTLYRQYLRLIRLYGPTAFVMENVKGLLSSRFHDRLIFDQILRDLRRPGNGLKYTLFALGSSQTPTLLTGDECSPEPEEFVIRCERHGIPQARHRVIVIGVREDFLSGTKRVLPSLPTGSETYSTRSVLSGLPKLRSGLSREHDSTDAWRNAIREAAGTRWLRNLRNNGQKMLAERVGSVALDVSVPRAGRGNRFIASDAAPEAYGKWFWDETLGGVCNHQARAHIRGDLHRYLFAACYAAVHESSPRLGDFPDELLPNHANVGDAITSSLFNDRFRVQLWRRPATTVTAHISKDGHYFIHPDPYQVRSLTVREAARLQTFPDNYFFEGPRTEQYRQVGNAVPPLLAKQIAAVIANILALGSVGT